MLQNNITNKAKFFSQYLGQMVSYPEMDGKIVKHKLVAVGYEYLHVNYKRKIKGCIGSELPFKDNGNHNSNALNAKLILTPLSKITDEHALYIGKIWYSEEKSLSVEKAKSLVNSWNNYEVLSLSDWASSIIDYLRLNGYAVPYLQCSVDTLISYGWIVLA